MGVLADLGTKINMRKRAVRIDPDVMEDIGTEWDNKRDWVSPKIRDMGDETEEITLDEFFLRDLELFSTIIDNYILVQVAINDEGIGRGSEEIGEEVSYRYL